MKLDLQTQITINARPEKVWKILTNFSEYPNWNPFIKYVEGDFVVGNKIKARIQPPDSNVMNFTPKVLTYRKNMELSWLGHVLFPGLFDGVHKFVLIDNGDQTTTFQHSENFQGILVPLFKKQLLNNTKRGFIAMNEKLKELAEK